MGSTGKFNAFILNFFPILIENTLLGRSMENRRERNRIFDQPSGNRRGGADYQRTSHIKSDQN